MCSREEVQEISDRAEHRMEKRLEDSHMAVAETISKFGGEITAIKDRLNQHFVEQSDIPRHIAEILEQAKKTNGRINKLEQWRMYITGGITMLSLLVVPVFIALVIKMI